MAKTLTVHDVERLIDSVVRKSSEQVLREISGKLNGHSVSEFLGNHEFIDVIRAAFEQQDVADLIYRARQIHARSAQQGQPTAADRALHDRESLALTTRARAVLANFVSELTKPQLNQITGSIGELKRAITETRTAVEEHRQEVDRVLKGQNIESLIEDGPLKERYLSEFPAEKEIIVDYLAKHVFSNEVRCFLQASTTILRLAARLREQGLPRRSLVHTNSTLFPYLMLGKQPDFQIYTVCGKRHDPKCCGWLFDGDDREAETYVRNLFQREHDRVELAVITPQYMTIDGAAHFAREDTCSLVRLLLSVADRALILTPGPRVYVMESDLPARRDTEWHSIGVSAGRPQQQREIVVGGTLDRLSDATSCLQELSNRSAATVLHCEQRPSEKWIRLTPNGQ